MGGASKRCRPARRPNPQPSWLPAPIDRRSLRSWPYGLAVLLLIYAQVPLMYRFMKDPVKQALGLSAFGVPLLVAGMMVSAFAWHHVQTTTT